MNENARPTVLVTGAAGFLGFHLTRDLTRTGCRVIGIDSLLTGQERNVKELRKIDAFQFIRADVNDTAGYQDQLESIAPKIDQIFHLACPASPPLYQKDMLHTLDTCYVGSRNIFELALRHKARVLVASTSEIYGDPEVHPQPESYRGNVNTMGPRSCYDEGKRILETLGFIYQQKGVEVRVARIFNTYGPRMCPEDGRVLTNFISQALRGEDLTIYGSGEQTRSFCYCDDLIRGFRMLMNSGVHEPVNLGSQDEFSVKHMAEMIRDIIAPKAAFKNLPLPKDDPRQRRPDTSRAFELLNWKPQISLKEGLTHMISDFRENPELFGGRGQNL